MQAFLKPYYTISTSLLLSQYSKPTLTINEKINLNIVLNEAASITPFLFVKLNSIKNNYIFSISSELIVEDGALQELLPRLFLLASLNLFEKENQIIIPILTSASDKSHDEKINIITSYFNNQGIDNVKLPFFNRNDIKEDIQNTDDCSFLKYSSKSPTSINRFLVGNNLSILKIIFFDEEIYDLALFNKIVHHFTSLEKINRLSLTGDDFLESYIEKSEFEKEKRLWKKRVLLYKNFLSLSKTVQEKEYYEVLDWYHKEYETLPLWYKQFGHIIKVLMGKRSFRSLFNDNVKKYKD